jgi:hypothetical protein
MPFWPVRYAPRDGLPLVPTMTLLAPAAVVAAGGAAVAPRSEVVAVAAEEHAAAVRAMPTPMPAR